MIPLSLNSATRIGLNVLLLLAGVVALRLGESVVVPLIIALILASVLAPAASWLQRALGIRWTLACAAVIVGLVLLNVFLTLFFWATVSRMAQQFPSANDPKQMIEMYQRIRGKLEGLSPWELDPILFPANPETVGEIRVYQYLIEYAPQLIRVVADLTGGWVLRGIVILFTLLFLLLEGRMLTRRVVQIFGPSEEMQSKASQVIHDMARQVRTYLVWRTIINFGLTIVLGLVYSVAGLQNAWTWAISFFILNYIPYLGPLVAGLPPVVDAFLSHSPGSAMVILIVYAALIVIEGYLIVPLLMGRSMDLNATTVMLACLFWELVWGVTGLFLAMPIMAGIKAILYHVPEWRAWANLMSAEDVEPTMASLGKMQALAVNGESSLAPQPGNLTNVGP
jgi:AI-2 transport protein TqsA